MDRVLAARFGVYAIKILCEGKKIVLLVSQMVKYAIIILIERYAAQQLQRRS